jgi:3-hydroxyisobutyrate dehydrogenase
MAKVAFLGTGIMGVEMAHRLIDAGHELAVYNRTGTKTQTLAAAGAAVAVTPAAAAHAAQFIFAMVADDAASRAVWQGPEGVEQADLNPGVIAVECSTLSHDRVLELHASLSRRGIRFADCPVTGGPVGAQNGTLQVLAGADVDTLDRLRPVLAAFSKEVIHFGPVGSGTSYKLVVNLIGAVQAASLAEGLLIAEQAGLDPEKIEHALSRSTVASPHVQYLLKRMLQDDHDNVYFSAALRHKDASYALRLAESYKLKLPTSQAAMKIFDETLARGAGHRNSSIIHQVLRDLQKRKRESKKS